MTDMLEALIRRNDRRIRHMEAPLLAEREQFLQSLICQGTTESQVRTIAAELLNVIRVMNMKELRMVEASEIQDAGERWLLDDRVARPCTPTLNAASKFKRAAFKWLRFHDKIQPASIESGPFGDVLPLYASYIKGRVAQGTKRSYLRIARDFLISAEPRHPSMATLIVGDFEQYLEVLRGSGKTPGTLATHCQAIRTFLRYCEMQKLTPLLRADQVRSPPVRRYDPDPRGPAWKDVRRLLKSGSKDNIADIRARAILFLCAIYALRASEVANLRLVDFDWVGETVTLRRCKGGGVQRFPLQFEVGNAIQRYICEARPVCSCRSLFVTLNPPHRRLYAHTIAVVVKRRMVQLGIKAPTTGPHSLRHSCATELLNNGVSVREIADFLGHRDVESVSVYAKCSIKALRRVASFQLDELQ